MHGVRPEMSATAGSGADRRIDDSASAAENAFSCDDASVFSWFGLVVVLQRMVAVGLGFWVSLGLRVVGLERFVGMVRDMFVLIFVGEERIEEEGVWEKGREEKVFRFCEGETGGG